jgi:GntR family transcriptional repressor for pyruvate dehydrogenase complex
LEVEIAGLAAERITPGQLADLRQAVLDLQRTDNLDGQIEADLRFHKVLADATGNPLFGIILDVLAHLCRESRRKTLRQSGVAVALGYHQRILGAVEVGDVRRARDEMAQHIERTKRDIEGETENREQRTD